LRHGVVIINLWPP